MMCAMIAGFLIQVFFERAIGTRTDYFRDFTALSTTGIKSWAGWTVVTYALLHANVIHLLGNLVAIYFLGRELLPQIGERRFVWFSAAAAATGGLVWLLVHFERGGSLVGASAIACALIMLFACLYPNREMSFLFFFVPVTIKPKHLAWIMAAFSVAGLVTGEIPGGRFATGIAHSAHIGGMLAALAYFRFVHLREWQTPDGVTEIELPRWLRKKSLARAAAPPAPKYSVNFTSRESLRAEVDRILDKINSQGFGALTSEEKRLLDEAKDSLSQR
jgi:membrane associated rhomboid family serine protease